MGNMGKGCIPVKASPEAVPAVKKSSPKSPSSTEVRRKPAAASDRSPKDNENRSNTEVDESSDYAPLPSAVAKIEISSLSCDDAAQFEKFDRVLTCRNLPGVIFTDDLSEQRVWRRCSVKEGCVTRPTGAPNVVVKNPVVMSPAYKGVVLHPETKRYMHFRGVGFIFERPFRGEFMAPSIDTVLVCHALGKLFDEASVVGKNFGRIIDIGAGSGFIGKFAAVHAPGASDVCLVDIDPCAKEYWLHPGFGSASVPHVRWSFQVGDACKLLQRDSHYNLIISNPPYIPTEAETSQEMSVDHICGFWEGCGLLAFLLDILGRGILPDESHLVVAITSLTLKSRHVCKWLSDAPSKGIKVRVLDERELAWKAWYAGRGTAPSYLLASAREGKERQRIGTCEYYVGATKPNRSREGGDKDEIGPSANYHWHVAYVLDICRIRTP